MDNLLYKKESFDASLVLQYFCLLEPQGVPLPWEDRWQTISDVDGNSEIEAFDASLILQYSVDLIDIFPVEDESVVTRKEGRSSTAKGAESAEEEKMKKDNINNRIELAFLYFLTFFRVIWRVSLFRRRIYQPLKARNNAKGRKVEER